MPPKADTKSYLSETISSFSPWGSRTASPKPGADQKPESGKKDNKGVQHETAGQRAHDHRIDHRHRLNMKSYPKDCPPLPVQWYFASDVAKRKPNYAVTTSGEIKSTAMPKKWVAFSTKDSRAIESAFQKIPEQEEQEHGRKDHNASINVDTSQKDDSGAGSFVSGQEPRSDGEPNTSIENMHGGNPSSTKVPVNEDYLFDVDIENRELGPTYWLGPVYETRRGTWFYTDGTTLRPCDENLALQLEEGYIKTAPWRRTINTEATPAAETAKPRKNSVSQGISAVVSEIDNKAPDVGSSSDATSQTPVLQGSPPTYRLFGAHMNSVVTYQDATTAWLISDDFLSRMSSTMYQRFAGGAHLSGTKVIRGFVELAKKKTGADTQRPGVSTPASANRSRSSSADGAVDTSSKKDPAPSQLFSDDAVPSKNEVEMEAPQPETAVRRLERQMSNMVSATFVDNPEKQEEEARKLAEQEISDDYRDTPGDPQDREIEHLVLVTHGIGQRLGARFETFNFIHDVNELRKTLKSIYMSSPDLQALNADLEKLPQNCRIQVLPICWRHLLDFPKQSLKHNRKEYDLADSNPEEDNEYPSLQDITVEGVPALRNILADLALDILIYQTPAYKDHIARIVVDECNRIYKLFQTRNPSFNGKVSLIGHSLGSALFFDLLSEQADDRPAFEKAPRLGQTEKPEIKLDFNVDSFFCLGSPIGLFQMLKGKTLESRRNPNEVTLDGSSEGIENPFFAERAYVKPMRTEAQRSAIISSPKCQQLYNIFHPTDPIAYRLEPLISPSMATMKPQNLPYVKKSFLSAPMGYGLTGIPSRVSQGFTSYLSSFSSGLADKFIHRSLGLSPSDAAKLGQTLPAQAPNQQSEQSQTAQSAGAGTNIVDGGVISSNTNSAASADSRKRKAPHGTATDSDAQEGRHPPTLLDSELETLYSGFQKGRSRSRGSDANMHGFDDESPSRADVEERGRKLRREEAKVRALNSNGRVDYSIQEGAFDISFLGSIASHLAYWTDEDVCHFLISQLLARQRVVGRSPSVRASARRSIVAN